VISKNPSKLHLWTTLKTEAAIVSQRPIIIYQSPECNTPEDVNLHQHHCRNLKYHMMYFWQKLYFCLTFVLASLSFLPSNGKDFIAKIFSSLVVSWLVSWRGWKASYSSNLSWQVPVQKFSKTVISVHSCFVNTPEEPAPFMFTLPEDGSRGSYQTPVSSNQTKQC